MWEEVGESALRRPTTPRRPKLAQRYGMVKPLPRLSADFFSAWSQARDDGMLDYQWSRGNYERARGASEP